MSPSKMGAEPIQNGGIFERYITTIGGLQPGV